MRKTTRVLTASALSLPIALGVSGVAMADTAEETTVRGGVAVSTNHPEQRGENEQDEGLLEELLNFEFNNDEFNNDEESEQNHDEEDDYQDQQLLGGIL